LDFGIVRPGFRRTQSRNPWLIGLGARSRHCDFKGRLTGLLHFETRKKPYYERFIAAAKGPAKTILAITKREHEPWNVFFWDGSKAIIFSIMFWMINATVRNFQKHPKTMATWHSWAE
jgi:hypothetical protein